MVMRDISVTANRLFCRSEGEFVMVRGNTKQEILDAALELFSLQGFEATSICAAVLHRADEAVGPAGRAGRR